jgi:hypothetical protein
MTFPLIPRLATAAGITIISSARYSDGSGCQRLDAIRGNTQVYLSNRKPLQMRAKKEQEPFYEKRRLSNK